MELFRSGKKVEEKVDQFYRNLQDEQRRGADSPARGEKTSAPYAYNPPTPETPSWQSSLAPDVPAASGVFITPDANLDGKLQVEGSVRIEGHYQGELYSQETVFVAEDAVVEANVTAAEVVVAGSLHGTVRAERRFHALPTSQVACHVTSPTLLVDEGAEINCTFSVRG